MPRQYSTKIFLRQASNALLRRYLQRREIGDDLPWDHLPEREKGGWKCSLLFLNTSEGLMPAQHPTIGKRSK